MSKNITLNIGDKGTWEGTIMSVIFEGQNNYSIVNLQITNGPSIIAKGIIPLPQKKDVINVKGTVIEDAKYGKEILVEGTSVNMPPETLSAIQFLSSGAIPGVGRATALQMVKMYKGNLDDYMNDKEKLVAIPGISERKAAKIVKAYQENSGLYRLFDLTNGKITYNQSKKIYEKYKNSAESVIKHNPYQLIYDIDGIGFSSADALALKIGFKFDSEERISAALIYCLKTASVMGGHCYLPEKELKEQVISLIFSLSNLKNVYYQDVLGLKSVPDNTEEWDSMLLAGMVKDRNRRLENMLGNWDNDAYRDKACKSEKLTPEDIDTLDYFFNKKNSLKEKLDKIICENAIDISSMPISEATNEVFLLKNRNKRLIIQKGRLGERACLEREIFIAENYVAENLVKMSQKGIIRDIDDSIIEKWINKIQSDENITFDEDQKNAVYMALKNRVSIITGGPGRGKTTIIKTVILSWMESRSAKNTKPKVVLLAPTGRAAKRMTESTGYPAFTIHKFLMSLKDGGVKDDDTLLIVDETSMVDLFLIKWLLSNILRTQLCFVGDVDQLPSVGPGAFLEDIIQSGTIPCTVLNTCHRNSGSIYNNSLSLNRGCRLQELETDNHFKTLWISPEVENRVISERAVEIYKKNVDKYGAQNMIVLTPMREKATGVNELNARIQEAVNPKSPNKSEYVLPSNKKREIFRVGDRVMQTKNNYRRVVIDSDDMESEGVFNGDVGTIRSINLDEEILEVLFDDDKTAIYPLNEIYELELAYATTYHKSQGSEYKFVICILTTADFMLLQRKILYTGESRGKSMVVFLGHAKAFQVAINNKSGSETRRHTMLNDRLVEFKDIYDV